MPPSRTNNRYSKTRKRDLLERSAFLTEAMRPCQRCSQSGRRCKIGEASEKCMECVKAGCFCDLAIPPAKLRRIHQERLRLRREVKEARARCSRLERQLESLEDQEEELVAAEWQNISELEREEHAVATPSEDILFDNKGLGEFLQREGIAYDFSPSGSSKSTGMVEICNSLLEEVLKKDSSGKE